ncbi:MAG: DUF3299 domain-containing protein [Oligoflexus sp.]
MSPKIGISIVVLLILGFPFLVTYLSQDTPQTKEVNWQQEAPKRGSVSHDEEMMGASDEEIRNAPKSQGPSGSHLPVLRWEVMQGLDFQTGKMSEELKKAMQEPVRIPGFVVPLEYSSKEATEFILVPTYGACIHVPPPPPNQMVIVKMKSGVAPRREHGPVWVHGRTKIIDADTEWGKVGFQLSADGFEPYKGGY